MPRSYNSPAMDDLLAYVAAAKEKVSKHVSNNSGVTKGLGTLIGDSLLAAEQERIKQSAQLERQAQLIASIDLLVAQIYSGYEDMSTKLKLINNLTACFVIDFNEDGDDVIYFMPNGVKNDTLHIGVGSPIGELTVPKELQISILDCSYSGITSITELPASLTTLRCSGNALSELPSALPPNLDNLVCSYNQLTKLPELPKKLSVLSVGSNCLQSLPELPDTLAWIDCSENEISKLPTLPSRLCELFCTANTLTNLPTLPDTLIKLEVIGNPLDDETIALLKARGL